MRGGEGTATGVGVVTVTPRDNRPPVMTTLTLDVPAGTKRSIDLTSAITDPDPGDKPTVKSVTGAGNGVTVSQTGFVIEATAAQGTKGTRVTLSVLIDDGKAKNNTATGTLTIVVIALPIIRGGRGNSDSAISGILA